MLAHADSPWIRFWYHDCETYKNNVDLTVLSDPETAIRYIKSLDNSRLHIFNGGMDGQGRYFGGFAPSIMSYLSNTNDAGLAQDSMQGAKANLGLGIISPTPNGTTVSMDGATFKQHWWRGIAQGFRGISVYKDQNPTGGNNLDAFPDLWGAIKSCVDETIYNPAIFPIVRTPAYASFSCISSDLGIRVRPCDYNGRGHLIMVNDTLADITATLTLSGLGYSPANIVDLFGVDANVAITGGTTASYTIPAQGRKVVQLN
jgi:hypothetical protein